MDLGEIELRPGAEIVGRVWDGEGAPVRGANVTVRSTATEEQRAGRTDAGGNIRLRGLEPGGALITATATLEGQKVTKSLQENLVSARVTEVEIILSSNAVLEGYVLPPPGVDASLLSLSLYPLQVDGRPVMGGRRDARLNLGYFREEGLVEGWYLLAASANRAGRRVTFHRQVEVTFPRSTTSVQPGMRRITGTAVLGETGQPAANATVIIRALTFPQSGIPALREWWEWTTVTDDTGRFQFQDLLPGTYETVAISADGANTAGEIFDLPGGSDVVNYTLELLP